MSDTPCEYYVVLAEPDVRGGEFLSIVQIVTDPVEAIKTARNVESLGYNFSYHRDVFVYRITLDKTYPAKYYETSLWGEKSKDNPIIYTRSKLGDGREGEIFYDKKIEHIVALALLDSS